MQDQLPSDWRRPLLFGLLFSGLTAVTAVVLVFAFRFFSSAPVQAEIEGWFTSPAPAVHTALLTAVKEPIPALPSPVPTQSSPSLPELADVPRGNGRLANLLPLLSDSASTDPPEQALLPLPATQTTSEAPVMGTLAVGELIIPSLGVSQGIVHVPVIAGQWDVASLGMDIGLLQTTGTQPGDNTGMAFVGHVTIPGGGGGPFANLILLEHGQEVIYRWRGTDYIYEVERIFLVHPQSVATLYQDDGDTIVLATCSSWDYVNWDYAKRLVTRARLVRQDVSPKS